MRSIVLTILEHGRVRTGPYRSDASYGLTGAFSFPGPCGTQLVVIASSEGGWEHVSVSTKTRCPNWEEMCFVKDIFWQDEEAVMQLHPPKSSYVNCHPTCLHMWRPVDGTIPLPPSEMVGPKQGEEVA